jgi:hypothetical protein
MGAYYRRVLDHPLELLRIEFTTQGSDVIDYAVVLLLDSEKNKDGSRLRPRDDRRMGKAMTADSNHSPAAKVMDEAINLAIEGRSPYPERAAFIDADTPSAGHDIERAADEGLPVVLVSADGSTRVLKPELATH